MSTALETRNQDANRRLESVVRIGTVQAVDYTAGKCRVQTGGLLTEWLPWMERRCGDTRDWDPPFIGEQVTIFASSGELAGGVVLSGIPSDRFPPPIHDPNKCHRRWSDGALEEYDHATHRHLLDVPAGGAITLHIGATTLTLTSAAAILQTPTFLVDAQLTKFTGAVQIDRGLNASGNVISDGNLIINGSEIVGGARIMRRDQRAFSDPESEE